MPRIGTIGTGRRCRDEGDRDDLAGVGIGQVLDEGDRAEEPLGLGEGEFDRGDGVVLVTSSVGVSTSAMDSSLR